MSKHLQSTSVLLDYVDVLPAEPRWRGIGRIAPCWEHADTSGSCITRFDVCREGQDYQWSGYLRGECDGQISRDEPYVQATTSFDLREAVLEFLDPMAGAVTVTVAWERTSLADGISYTLYNGFRADDIVLASLELSPNNEERQIAWEVPGSVRWTATVSEPQSARTVSAEGVTGRFPGRLIGAGTFRFFIWNKTSAAFRIQSEIEWDGFGHGGIRSYDEDGQVVSEREW